MRASWSAPSLGAPSSAIRFAARTISSGSRPASGATSSIAAWRFGASLGVRQWPRGGQRHHRVIEPFVMGRALNVHPVVIVLGVIAGALEGIIESVIATPSGGRQWPLRLPACATRRPLARAITRTPENKQQ